MITIYICDPSDEKINEMLDYCHGNQLTLKSHEVADVSDVSGRWDIICTFDFEDEKDASIFKLKFQ